MINPSQLTQQELQAWDRCQEVGEDFMRLSQADQLILTKMIERQLTQGTAHFREQAEAWLPNPTATRQAQRTTFIPCDQKSLPEAGPIAKRTMGLPLCFL